MSYTVILPTSSSHTGALTGGASAHAVLADLDDTTYVELDDGEVVDLTVFSNPTIPAGAVVTRHDLVARAYRLSSGGLVVSSLTARLRSDATPTVEDEETRSIVNTAVQQFVVASINGDLGSNDFEADLSLSVSTGSLRLTLAWIFVYYVEQPVVNVTAPTGTLTTDNQPTVTWSNTLDSDGGGQFAANVRIFEEPVAGWGGFDPDTADEVYGEDFFGSATSWELPDVLANGSYRAYVKVAQFVNTSDWAYEDFDVDVPIPGEPTLLLTAQERRNRIELAENTGTAADTTGFQVQARLDGEWENIRTTVDDGIVVGSPATLYDFESPNGTVRYRARAYYETAGLRAFSGWVEETVTRNSEQWSIVHPTQFVYNIGVDLRSFEGHDRPTRQTVHQPLGATRGVAIGTTRGAETGSIAIRCSDDATRNRVMAIAGTGDPVLLVPPSDHHERRRWVSLGDESIRRLIDKSWSTERDATYQWTEVDRPIGNLVEGDPSAIYPSDDLYPSDEIYPA